MKTYFHIDVEPVSITLECPHCHYEQIIEWEDVDVPASWSDDWGCVECPDCKKEIELGDYDYD